MCDKPILENDGTLEAVTYCYKNQEMYNVFVPTCDITRQICDKAVNTHPSTIQLVR